MHKKKRGESFRMSTNLIEQKGTEDSIQRRRTLGKNLLGKIRVKDLSLKKLVYEKIIPPLHLQIPNMRDFL